MTEAPRDTKPRAKAARDTDDGVILVNVLAVVALASAIVVTMLTLSQSGLYRSQRFGEAGQALAYAMGAETSAAIVLRRDRETSPAIDHRGEAWASLSEDDVAINEGTFSLAIKDAQARFNVNDMIGGGAQAVGAFRRIVAALGLKADVADRVYGLVRYGGSVDDLAELRQVGLDREQIATLSTLATALPGFTDLNVNTADERLIAALLVNPVQARFLVARRERAGFVTSDDLKELGVLLPPGMGLSSDYFRVATTVKVGDTQQSLKSLIYRRTRGGQAEAVVLSRRRGQTSEKQPARER